MKWDGVLSRSCAVSAHADRDASLLYYSCSIILGGRGEGGLGGGGGAVCVWGEGGGGYLD